MPSHPVRPVVVVLLLALVTAACGGGSNGSSESNDAPSTTVAASGPDVAAGGPDSVPLTVTEVAIGLDTVWALAWDSKDRLWYTQRGGLLGQFDGPNIAIDGVVEQGESGLMGLEIDADDNIYLMYTTKNDNRIVKRRPDGSGEQVLVSGIRRAPIHDGGRLRFGPDGTLYASTGDAGVPSLSQDTKQINGKILAIDPASGASRQFARGLRNTQGLCFAADGRFLSTEHGPSEGDEVNVLTDGFNGQWPDETGNGIKNWTPTIAPAGCASYDADLIPQWKGSLLFVTLKERDLRRLTFDDDGKVTGEEVLYDGQFGRLRDVRVGPDGAVYLATSNRDGRGSPSEVDDRILRIAPRGQS
ncbi:MAG: PQQ-dependent sugar dehydrogenase [Acidimicrobiales bacterium]